MDLFVYAAQLHNMSNINCSFITADIVSFYRGWKMEENKVCIFQNFVQ